MTRLQDADLHLREVLISTGEEIYFWEDSVLTGLVVRTALESYVGPLQIGVPCDCEPSEGMR